MFRFPCTTLIGVSMFRFLCLAPCSYVKNVFSSHFGSVWPNGGSIHYADCTQPEDAQRIRHEIGCKSDVVDYAASVGLADFADGGINIGNFDGRFDDKPWILRMLAILIYFTRESWTHLMLGCATVNLGEFPIDVDVGTGHFTISLDIRLCLAEPIENSYLLLIKPYSAYYSTIFLGRAKRFLNGFFLQGHWCAAVCRDVHPSFTRHCARGSWYPANRIFRGRLQCSGQN